MINKQKAAIIFDSELYNSRFDPTWNRHVLYSLAEWINGMAFRNINFTSNGKPVIKIAEIKNGISGQTKFTQRDYDSIYHVTDGDMLFSWSGQPDTSINVFRWRGPDGWLNQHIFKVHPKDQCLEAYFFYLLKYLNPNFVRIARNKQTTGLGHVTKRDLQNMKVGLPSEDKQRAIAHILGSLDDKIELNRQMNRTLEAMTQAIFKSWFVDFDPVRAKAEGRDPGLPKDIADLFPDSFEDSELGEIPKGWKIQLISSLLHINPRLKLSKGDVAKYVDMKSLPTSGFSVSAVVEKPFKGGSKFQRDDVLLARITPCLENGKTALVDFLCKDEVAFGSTEFIVLRGKNGVTSQYVYCLARNIAFREHCISSMVGSSGRQRVQNACFDHFKQPVPRENILQVFAGQTEPLFKNITANSQQIQTLSNLRDTLLPKLISGELHVPDAEKLMEGAK